MELFNQIKEEAKQFLLKGEFEPSILSYLQADKLLTSDDTFKSA